MPIELKIVDNSGAVDEERSAELTKIAWIAGGKVGQYANDLIFSNPNIPEGFHWAVFFACFEMINETNESMQAVIDSHQASKQPKH